MDYGVLQKSLFEKHDYLLYIYDVIADMVRQADKQELTSCSLTFKTEEEIISFKSDDDIFRWMDNNNRHDISIHLFKSHVFFSLLKDFCFYIYESISCASRGKVTVAYSLLRKPLRDNLLYIEWLLDDSESFYKNLLYGDVRSCDVANRKAFDNKRIEAIVRNASEKSYLGKQMNRNNLIYKLRFDNHEDISLQRIWNKSMHIVTSSRNYATQDGNLNFLFSDNEEWDHYWQYYYLVVPQIMGYAFEICESIFIDICNTDKADLYLNRAIRLNKYMNACTSMPFSDEIKDMTINFISLLEETKTIAKMSCEHCSKDIIINADIIKQMIDSWFVICPHCQQEHNICKYDNSIEYLIKNNSNDC